MLVNFVTEFRISSLSARSLALPRLYDQLDVLRTRNDGHGDMHRRSYLVARLATSERFERNDNEVCCHMYGVGIQ